MEGVGAGIVGGVISVFVATITAYVTTLLKFKAESHKISEDWRSSILEKYYEEFDSFQKLAQQFAIGIVFFEDPSRPGHHQKVFIPKNFNLTIGRADSNDIKCTDQTVSRIHALLSSGKSDVFIEDLFATNCTKINGNQISIRTKLKDNDRIEIGNVKMRFKKVSGWLE